MTEKKFCPNCGAPIQKLTAQYCGHCGAAFKETQPQPTQKVMGNDKSKGVAPIPKKYIVYAIISLVAIVVIAVIAQQSWISLSGNNQDNNKNNPNGLLSFVTEQPTQDYDFFIHKITKIYNKEACHEEHDYSRLGSPWCENSNYLIIDISMRTNKNCNSSQRKECPILSSNNFLIIDNTYHDWRRPYIYKGREIFIPVVWDLENFAKEGVFIESSFPEQLILPERGEVVRGFLFYNIEKKGLDTFMSSAKLVVKKPYEIAYDARPAEGETIFEIPDIYAVDYSKQKPLNPFAEPSSDVAITINSIKKIDNRDDPSLQEEVDEDAPASLLNSLYYRFVVIDITLNNNKKTPLDLFNVDFSLKDANNVYYKSYPLYSSVPHPLKSSVTIQPGETIRGEIGFMINKNIKSYELWVREPIAYYSKQITVE
jgi:hypothetical protein